MSCDTHGETRRPPNGRWRPLRLDLADLRRPLLASTGWHCYIALECSPLDTPFGACATALPSFIDGFVSPLWPIGRSRRIESSQRASPFWCEFGSACSSNAMLVLSRKVGERILIGEHVTVTVVRITGGGVRLGIEAPPEMAVIREELQQELGAKLTAGQQARRPVKRR